MNYNYYEHNNINTTSHQYVKLTYHPHRGIGCDMESTATLPP